MWKSTSIVCRLEATKRFRSSWSYAAGTACSGSPFPDGFAQTLVRRGQAPAVAGDRWNNGVFSLQGSGSFEGEESSREMQLGAEEQRAVAGAALGQRLHRGLVPVHGEDGVGDDHAARGIRLCQRREGQGVERRPPQISVHPDRRDLAGGDVGTADIVARGVAKGTIDVIADGLASGEREGAASRQYEGHNASHQSNSLDTSFRPPL